MEASILDPRPPAYYDTPNGTLDTMLRTLLLSHASPPVNVVLTKLKIPVVPIGLFKLQIAVIFGNQFEASNGTVTVPHRLPCDTGRHAISGRSVDQALLIPTPTAFVVIVVVDYKLIDAQLMRAHCPTQRSRI